MELASLREKARRDSEGINKKLQVFIHAAKLENWKAVADFALICNSVFVCVSDEGACVERPFSFHHRNEITR